MINIFFAQFWLFIYFSKTLYQLQMTCSLLMLETIDIVLENIAI